MFVRACTIYIVQIKWHQQARTILYLCKFISVTFPPFNWKSSCDFLSLPLRIFVHPHTDCLNKQKRVGPKITAGCETFAKKQKISKCQGSTRLGDTLNTYMHTEAVETHFWNEIQILCIYIIGSATPLSTCYKHFNKTMIPRFPIFNELRVHKKKIQRRQRRNIYGEKRLAQKTTNMQHSFIIYSFGSLGPLRRQCREALWSACKLWQVQPHVPQCCPTVTANYCFNLWNCTTDINEKYFHISRMHTLKFFLSSERQTKNYLIKFYFENFTWEFRRIPNIGFLLLT